MSDARYRVKALEKVHGDGRLDYVIMFRDTAGVHRSNDGEVFLPEPEEGLWRSTVDDRLVQGWIIMSEDLRGRI